MKIDEMQGFQIKGLKFVKQINRGSFGVIYEAISLKDSKKYAVKIEPNATNNPQLNFQYDVYNYFSQILLKTKLKNNYFPEIYGLFSNNQYTFMVMELLGKNLYQHFKEQNQLKDKCKVLQYGLKMFKMINFLHLSNLTYRDIKPENFVLNINQPQQLRLVDFGLCKMNVQKKQRSVNKNKRILIGTSRYASINSHEGRQVSSIDDIQSLCYVIIYLLKGKLPWQGLKIKSETQKNSQILKIKKNIKVKQLCQGLPEGIHKIMQYVRSFSRKQQINVYFLIDCIKMSYQEYQRLKTADLSNLSLIETQKILPDELSQVHHQFLKVKNQSLIEKSSQGSKNQSRNLKELNKKNTKKPLIKREFLIKQDENDSISQSISSQSEQENSRFAIL